MFSPPLLSTNKLKQIRKLKQKKYRQETGDFLCEGFRLFKSALDSPGLDISELIIEENFRNSPKGEWIVKNGEERGIDVFITDKSGMKSISEDITPPGIVFIVNKTTEKQIPIRDIGEKTILYLEKISDPGNLGTILRSASWFGIESILLSPECVDPWNSKSVRASAGAIFKTNIYSDVKYYLLSELFKKKKYKFIATVVSDGIPISKWKIGPKNILLFGPEASGLSKEIIKDADVHINIAGSSSIESLNLAVAAGIMLYEITRTRYTI